MRILHVGDIVGSPGRNAFQRIAVPMKQEGRVDAIIVNGENSAGGRGITPAIAESLLNSGADVITLGDHAWDQKEIYGFLDLEPRLLRPLNFAPGCPGRGWVTVETPAGMLSVVMLIGRVFLNPHDCPFRAIDTLIRQNPSLSSTLMVEMHAEATSEKIAMGRYLEGRVSSVVGTHTHVQTSDETILPKGTAYLTDLGMTGPKDSVLGRDVASILAKFLNGMPARFDVAKEDVALEGAIIEVNAQGRAETIERVREFI